MQAVSMPRQITKRKIQSVDFVRGLRVKRSPYGPLRERLRVQWRYRRGTSFWDR